MDLNLILITIICGLTPFVGALVHDLAPSEVVYSKKYLKWLLAALLAIGAGLAFGVGLHDSAIGLFAAGIGFLAVLFAPPEAVWMIAGIACGQAIIYNNLGAVGVLIISGIVFGSLHPKKGQEWLSFVLFLAGFVLMSFL